MTNEEFTLLAISAPADALKVWLDAVIVDLDEQDREDVSIGYVAEELASDSLYYGYNSQYQAESAFGYYLRKMQHIGGGEGEGEHVEVVIGFANVSNSAGAQPISYLRTTAFYDSYNGTDWGDSEWVQVYPREVLVTQYFNENEAVAHDNKK